MNELTFHKRKIYSLSILLSSLLIIIFLVSIFFGSVFPVRIFANEADVDNTVVENPSDGELLDNNTANDLDLEPITEIENETMNQVTPPKKPAWFTHEAIISETSIQLVWSEVNNASGYNIYRDGHLLAQVENAVSLMDVTVAPNQTYFYELEAFNAGGVSEMINFYVETLDTEPPLPPAVIKGKAVTANQIHLIWGPAVDNRGVAYYNIYYSRDDEAITLTHSHIIDQFYIHEGLGPSFTFNYIITAVDTSGNESSHSKILSVQTTDDLFDVVYEKLPLSISLDD